MHLCVYLSTYVAFTVINVVTQTYLILLQKKEKRKKQMERQNLERMTF